MNHSPSYAMRRAKKACLHLAMATLCILSTLPMGAQVSPRLLRGTPVTYNQNGPRIRIFSEDVKETVKLFVISDTILGWNKFVDRIPYSSYWILIPYFSAQILLFVQAAILHRGRTVRK